MDIVTDYLRSMISKQVDDRRLVLWFDPEKHYSDIVDNLSLPNTKIARYEGSFFALRNEIEPLMGAASPPRLVIYVPMDHEATHNALIEAEVAGVVMKPGQQPPARNTRLSIIARNALKPIVGEETATSIEKQVEAGKLGLDDLNKLAEKGEGITKGVVSVIFETGNPQEVALAFLSKESLDAKINSREAARELAVLLESAFEVELPDGESLDDWRARLARHILAADLIVNLRGEIPSQLATVKIASRPAARESCVTLTRNWRFKRDLGESYVAHSLRVAKELGLQALDFNQDQIAGVETFLEVERMLQRHIEAALSDRATDELVETAKNRQSGFWSEQMPDVQARWALTGVCGQLMIEADRIEKEIKNSSPEVGDIFNAYTESDRPWSLLDRHHRHMERRYHNFDFDLNESHKALEQLILKARSRYMEVASAMAEHFLRSYQKNRFRMPGALRQVEIFEKKVKPQVAEEKTAYVWVDALRYEMACELAETLSPEFDVKIEPAIATVPTITEIGMAALLPGAQESPGIAPVAKSKLGFEIKGTIIKDRKDRVKFLKANADAEVFDAKLDDLLPKPKKRIQDGIRDAGLVLVTSQEIDSLGEEENLHLARRYMDDVLHQLGRGIRTLRKEGVKAIIIAADHGYLFGDELESGMKIDAPGGDTADLHRRVWVGRGGTADPSYLRARLSDFGLGGELEIAAPWNFGCFKVQAGAKAYFHGGLSPQELIIPVITLTVKKIEGQRLAGEVIWKLIPGSQKISTRFFSVQVIGTAAGLYEPVPPKVRMEIKAKDEIISTPISASYGFEEGTGDVQLRLAEDDPRTIEPNTITLMIPEKTSQKTVTVQLLDATSGAKLSQLENVEMTIAI
ncbi:MAG: PglZ domain-containing protein [Blastocatellia bacterium]|nr:PglZ domain-containing protein [Blastocatellia bacterium]